MAQIAREYAWQPVRADVLPQAQGVKAGQSVPVKVVLLDGSGKLTNAVEKTDLIVEAVEPSGKIIGTAVEIAPGASSVSFDLPSMPPGLTKLTVRHPKKRVLESSNFVLITPAQANKTKSSGKPKNVAPVPKPSSQGITHGLGASLRNVNLTNLDFQPAESGPEATATSPSLILQVSGEGDSNVRADDISYERIAVYYMDAEPAKFPIQVWVTWNHGEVQPNPIVIKKGEHSAEAHWTSGSAVAGAKVAIANIKPAIAVIGSQEATINFVEPVSGVAFVNPPITMSIVDAPSVHARFYDLAGNFVKTSSKRNVMVSTNSAIVRFQPDSQDTDWDFQTSLIPTGWGTAEIEVATPGYPAFRHKVDITYLAILWLCIGGGLLGSLADILTNSNGARGWRISAHFVVGVLAAVLACWAYVVIGIPDAPAGILHSHTAVIGISLVGGWAGIFVFRTVAKTLGMQF